MYRQRDRITFSAESQVVNDFLITYSELEQLCKEVFVKEIKSLNSKGEYQHVELLYKIKQLKNNIIIDFSSISFTLGKISPGKKNDYSLLTLNEMVLLIRKFEISPFFDEEIESFQRKNMSLKLIDVLKKLIDIRNKLAHETSRLNLSEDKFIIDSLSHDTVKNNLSQIDFLQEIPINILEESYFTLLIACIYMKKIIPLVKELRIS